ncbi:MAG: phytanoyl-CoA dioxygenase family protein [Proteobacteria bacterium]|nr:phytanoyl-CoA dioxygenase family protein [Pseudomonadota bacterium]
MDMQNWKAPGIDNYREIQALGLESHVAEIDTYGFTVVPPEKAAPAGFADKLRDAVIRHTRSQDGADAHINVLEKERRPVDGEHLFHTVGRDPVFREATVSPAGYVLAAHILGASLRIYQSSSILKASKILPVPMHCDSISVPPPLPPWCATCNVTWILSDYTKENGALFMVPGSHRLQRHPTLAEQPKSIGGQGSDDNVVPIVAKAGSICVFTGNTWHGAFGKDNDSTRVSYATIYCRTFVMPAEDFSDVTDEMIAPHGDRFARLVWRNKWQGYGKEGPRQELLALSGPSTQSPFG